jgi:hypothetical protein
MFALGSDSTASSNVDLEHRVAQYLATRHVFSLRQLRVHARDGVVTLHGRVASFHEKQVGLATAQRVAGVLRVVDATTVADNSDPDSARLDKGFSPPNVRRDSALRQEQIAGSARAEN